MRNVTVSLNHSESGAIGRAVCHTSICVAFRDLTLCQLKNGWLISFHFEFPPDEQRLWEKASQFRDDFFGRHKFRKQRSLAR